MKTTEIIKIKQIKKKLKYKKWQNSVAAKHPLENLKRRRKCEKKKGKKEELRVTEGRGQRGKSLKRGQNNHPTPNTAKKTVAWCVEKAKTSIQAIKYYL